MDLPRGIGDISSRDQLGGRLATAKFDGIKQQGLVVTERFALQERWLVENPARKPRELPFFGEIFSFPALVFDLEAFACRVLLCINVDDTLRHLSQQRLYLAEVQDEIDSLVIAARLHIDQEIEL